MRLKPPRARSGPRPAKTKLAVGDKVTVPLESEMRDFHSASLNRDFPLIYFVTQIAKPGEAAPPWPWATEWEAVPRRGAGGGDGQADGASARRFERRRPLGEARVAGGKNGDDQWHGGEVQRRILGRNWLHVQDGSGNAGDGSNDLAVTTDAVAKVGDIVTVTGKVTVDKDFGAGYAYKVMLEEAKIK